MEIVGWLTIILLCALALTFIAIELGPVIHAEVSFWKYKKQKAIEAKEDKLRFKEQMKELKFKVKKLEYMKKNSLDTSELELGMQEPSSIEDITEEPKNDDNLVEIFENTSIAETSEINDICSDSLDDEDIIDAPEILQEPEEQEIVNEGIKEEPKTEQKPVVIKKSRGKKHKHGK